MGGHPSGGRRNGMPGREDKARGRAVTGDKSQGDITFPPIGSGAS